MGEETTPEIVEVRLDWTTETMTRQLDRLRLVLGRARAKDPIRILEAVTEQASRVVAAAEEPEASKTYRSAQQDLAYAINRELRADDAPAQLEQVDATSIYRLVSRVSTSMETLMTGVWLISVAALLGMLAVGVIVGFVAPWPWLTAYVGLLGFTVVLSRVGERLGIPRSALIVLSALATVLWMASALWPLWTSGRVTIAVVFFTGIALTWLITRLADGALRRMDTNLPDPR